MSGQLKGYLQGLPRPEGRESARDQAARAVVDGYERALTMLDHDDVDERAWYQAQLRDARLAAGLAPVVGLPCADARPHAVRD